MVPAQAVRRPRMRLINPNSPLSNITMPAVIRNMTFSRKALFAPTGLMICAAVMPKRWDVELIDECTLDTPHRARPDVDLVAISAMTTQARRAYEIGDEYRRLGVPVVMGGIHPSALPEEALQHCNSVCCGDAESTLPHLIADFERVPSADSRQPAENGAENGDWLRAAQPRGACPRFPRLRRIYDWTVFETAPIATPRKDVINPADYLVANPIQTTRGCPHNCNFCTTPAVFGRKFRQRAVADIVEEVRAVCAVKKPWCFIFADDNFGGNQEWALELCQALKPLKIAWASQCDIMISRSDRLLRAMRESGCQGLILGLESPRQDTLTEAGKKFVRTDTYEWRIRKIQSAGISLWGAFMFGFDHDTWEDCMYACRFAQRMNLSLACFPILTPYPGTEFFRQFQREGRLRTLDWERYNGASVVYEPRRMTAKELRHAQMAAFAEFYTPRSALRRLRVWPVKSRAWAANLASWKGIRYYYAKKGRRVPTFRDFLDLNSPAWDYAGESWAPTGGVARNAAQVRCAEIAPPAAPTDALAEPLGQAAARLTAGVCR